MLPAANGRLWYPPKPPGRLFDVGTAELTGDGPYCCCGCQSLIAGMALRSLVVAGHSMRLLLSSVRVSRSSPSSLRRGLAERTK